MLRFQLNSSDILTRGKYMSQRLKRWESPRSEGRNKKGRGGAARHRQLKKQIQVLRQKLKNADTS